MSPRDSRFTRGRSSFFAKAAARRRVLDVLEEQDAWSDVVREAQELVELVLKAALRVVGIDPPKWHDVGPLLLEHKAAFPDWFAEEAERLSATSWWLRHERELSFYGDIDVIPTRRYSREDAERAKRDALHAYDVVDRLLTERNRAHVGRDDADEDAGS